MKPICGYSQCENFHWRMHPDLDDPYIDRMDFIEERVKECLSCKQFWQFPRKSDNFKEAK